MNLAIVEKRRCWEAWKKGGKKNTYRPNETRNVKFK